MIFIDEIVSIFKHVNYICFNMEHIKEESDYSSAVLSLFDDTTGETYSMSFSTFVEKYWDSERLRFVGDLCCLCHYDDTALDVSVLVRMPKSHYLLTRHITYTGVYEGYLRGTCHKDNMDILLDGAIIISSKSIESVVDYILRINPPFDGSNLYIESTEFGDKIFSYKVDKEHIVRAMAMLR